MRTVRVRAPAEENGPRYVLARQAFLDERPEEALQKEPREPEHREGLDEPVDDEGDRDAFRVATHAKHALTVDLHHHQVDHGPDENGNRQVHLRDFPLTERVRHGGNELAEGHSGGDAERDPQAQVPFEDAETLLALFGSRVGRVRLSVRRRLDGLRRISVGGRGRLFGHLGGLRGVLGT
jgi:hypothetical protein